MRTYRTPGIYFEQKDAAAAVIGPLRTDVAGFVGLAMRGPLHTAVRIESLTQFENVFGGPMPQAYLAYAVQGYFANGGATCWVVRAADPAAAAVATLDIVDDGGTVLTVRAGSPGSWGNSILARWMTRGGSIVSLTLHYPDGTEELIRNPRAMNERGDDVLPSDRIAPRVHVEQTLLSADKSVCFTPSQPLSAGAGWLAGGADGLDTLTESHITGEGAPPGVRWGLATLELIDEIAMVAIPDIMPKLRVPPRARRVRKPDCHDLDAPVEPPPPTQPDPEFPPEFPPDGLQEALVRHCEKMHDRVAILDPVENMPPQQAIGAALPFEMSSFAALYYPWIVVDDPLRLTGLVRTIPSSGAVAGVFARSDRKYGVHKPPANEVVQGALNVRFAVDDILHGALNEAGVNVLRSFPGRGIRVYGARTTSRDSLWRFVNVRRLISMIEKAIDKGTQWIVFEPNAAALRREIDRTVRSFLESLFRRGMLDGIDSDQAYSVKCDEATTPPEEEDRGRVICQIGVLPPPPAEFVVVVIGKTQNALEILKEGGAIDA